MEKNTFFKEMSEENENWQIKARALWGERDMDVLVEHIEACPPDPEFFYDLSCFVSLCIGKCSPVDEPDALKILDLFEKKLQTMAVSEHAAKN
jgi:hypothetical protein